MKQKNKMKMILSFSISFLILISTVSDVRCADTISQNTYSTLYVNWLPENDTHYWANVSCHFKIVMSASDYAITRTTSSNLTGQVFYKSNSTAYTDQFVNNTILEWYQAGGSFRTQLNCSYLGYFPYNISFRAVFLQTTGYTSDDGATDTDTVNTYLYRDFSSIMLNNTINTTTEVITYVNKTVEIDVTPEVLQWIADNIEVVVSLMCGLIVAVISYAVVKIKKITAQVKGLL